MAYFPLPEARRTAPRLDVDAVCREVVGGRARLSLAVEMSADGIRLERPYRPGPGPEHLEIELPDESDIVIAGAMVRYDEIRRPAPGSMLRQAGGLIRVTGIRLVSVASRDFRLLRDYVMDRYGANQSLAVASCYARG